MNECGKEEILHKLLCMACLCFGRRLRNITDEKVKGFYLDALKEIQICEVTPVVPHLCWECEAVIKRAVSFRKQAQDSYRIIQSYPSEKLHECLLSEVVRPSNLSIHTISASISPNEVLSAEEQSTFKDEVKLEVDVIKDDSNDAETREKGDDEKKWYNSCNSSRAASPVHSDEDPDEVKDVKPQGILQIDVNGPDNNDSNYLEVKIGSLVPNIKNEKHRKKNNIGKLRKVPVQKAKLPKNGKKQVLTKKIITVDISYEEMLLEREKDAANESYLNAPYKCESCILGFDNGKTFKTHMSSKHAEDKGENICPVCKTIVASVESFTSHYKRHMRRYECSMCQLRTMDIKVMRQHYYSTHEIKTKEYTCDVCGKVSNSIDTHRYHKDSHKARVPCSQCDKTFTHRAGLMNHRVSIHGIKKMYPCTLCDKKFRWKTSLKRHLERHVDKTPAVAYCSDCAVSFSSVCSYQKHLKNSLKHVTHEQLRYICDHCGRRFSDKYKIRNHIEDKHLHRRFQCLVCMKWFKNCVGLDQHTRYVHNNRPHNKICHHCGKGFPTKVQLESHIRSHTGERPYICEFCPTTFSQKSNLYKHLRVVHLNEKPKRYVLSKKKRIQKPKVPALDVPLMDPYRTDQPLFYITPRNEDM